MGAKGCRWFNEVYYYPDGTAASCVHGTQEQGQERLEALVDVGANHIPLNPVCRPAEQLQALTAVVRLF